MRLNSSIQLQAAHESFKPGDEVSVRGQRMKGVVKSVTGNQITVRLQNGTELERDEDSLSRWNENSISSMWKDRQP
jgi:preprotein translocase subunit YajC